MECLTSSIVTCNVAEIFSMFFGKSAIAWVAEPNWWAKFSNSVVADPESPELNSFISNFMLCFSSSTTLCIMSLAGEDTVFAIWSICSTTVLVVASTLSINGRIFCCICRERVSSNPWLSSIARSVENDFRAFVCWAFSERISRTALATGMITPDSFVYDSFPLSSLKESFMVLVCTWKSDFSAL